MADDDFIIIDASVDGQPSINSKAEQDILESDIDKQEPNSVRIRIFKTFALKWHAENGISVFCFILVIIILISIIILSIISYWIPPTITWLSDVFKTLGQAILTLIGAVVGSSASSAVKSRRNSK